MRKDIIILLIVSANLCSPCKIESKSFIPSLDRIRAKIEKARSQIESPSLNDLFTKKNSNLENTLNNDIKIEIVNNFKKNPSQYATIRELLLKIEREVSAAYWDKQPDFLAKLQAIFADNPTNAISFIKEKLKERYDNDTVENNNTILKLKNSLK